MAARFVDSLTNEDAGPQQPHAKPQEARAAPQKGAELQAAGSQKAQDRSTFQRVVSLIFNLCCFLSGQYHMTSTGDDDGSFLEHDKTELVINDETGANHAVDDDTETVRLVKHDKTSRHRYEWKCVIFAVIQAILFGGFVATNIAHVTLNIVVEVCRIMHITCSPRIFENDSDEVNCTMPYQYWKISTAILASTTAELVSYISMAVVLYLIYGYFSCCKPNSHCCCASVKKALEQNKPFSPFCDLCTFCQNSSTALTPEQPTWFIRHYFICMFIFIGTIAVIVYGGKMYQRYPCQINGINLASYVLFLICQFCSIQSVFIFSKIVYIITGKLKQLVKAMDKVIYNDEEKIATDKATNKVPNGATNEATNEATNKAPNRTTNEAAINKVPNGASNEAPNEATNKAPNGATDKAPNGATNEATNKASNKATKDLRDDLKIGDVNNLNEHEVNEKYYRLQNIDQDFIKKAKPILKLFGVWFILHWILNALTTVLLSAVIIELVLDLIAYKWQNAGKFIIPTKDVGLEAAYIAYLVLFVMGHAYLFVYPCFRAASITATREKLIVDVSRSQWHHIPQSVKTDLISYLKTQNFSFKVPLGCAEFSFNFTMAFVSLFIGILGGFLNLHFF